MTIGIVGLGLIGGSFAKAYSDNDEHKVLAYNRSKEVIQAAYNDKAIDGELNEEYQRLRSDFALSVSAALH